MQFGDFGQPRLEKLLRDLLLRHRLAGSFLFDGPSGVGKEALAVELGRLLNCERHASCAPRGLFRAPPVVADGDACSSCRRFRSLQHPDLHLVFPVPSRFRENEAKPDIQPREDFRERRPDSVREVLAGKAIDPWHKPMFDRPVGIHADVLRDVILPAVQRRPVEASMKVIILSDADQMAFGIGNLLLKTLEEPPADCLLVVTSAVPDRLLPTIRSRCQRLTFTPLAADWMVPRLELLHHAEPTEARIAASMSQGSMLGAGRFLGGALKGVRERAFEIMRAAADCEVLDLLQLAASTTQEYSGRRQLLPVLLHMVALVARDTLMLVEGASVALVNEDRRRELQQLARAFGSEGLRTVICQAEEAERQLAGYAHAELTLGSLFIGLARESDKARALAGRD
ncbi:MAG: ATP-binding protein [Candidatus Krumholzibacteriia bacterium]